MLVRATTQYVRLQIVSIFYFKRGTRISLKKHRKTPRMRHDSEPEA